MNCAWCDEPIEGDSASTNGGQIEYHRNCMLRQVIGSVAHVSMTCGCFVEGSTAGDPPEMTLREAADKAVELWKSNE